MEEFSILISDLYAHILAFAGANGAEKHSHLFILAIKSNEAWNSTLKAASSALNFSIDFRGWYRMFIQHPSACQVYEKSEAEYTSPLKRFRPANSLRASKTSIFDFFERKGIIRSVFCNNLFSSPRSSWLWRFICSHAAFRKLENSARFVTEFNWLSPRWKKTFLVNNKYWMISSSAVY